MFYNRYVETCEYRNRYVIYVFIFIFINRIPQQAFMDKHIIEYAVVCWYMHI